MVVVHSCDAEVADLDEAWPEGDAVRKPSFPLTAHGNCWTSYDNKRHNERNEKASSLNGKEPDGSVPGTVIGARTGEDMAIVTVDLGCLPVLVRDAEVVRVYGCQAPLPDLNKAIAPMSELWIAFSIRLLGEVGAGPVGGQSVDHMIMMIPVAVACVPSPVVASENLHAPASGGEEESEVVVVRCTESHFAHLYEPISEGDACRKPFTTVEDVPPGPMVH